jgi:hypothetical protein
VGKGNDVDRGRRFAKTTNESRAFRQELREEQDWKRSSALFGLLAGDAEHALLGQGDALDGEQLLGVDGVVDADEIVPEVRYFLKFFEADDGEVRGGEAVFAGVLGGAGLAFGGTGAGGVRGVDTIGGELFFRRRAYGNV